MKNRKAQVPGILAEAYKLVFRHRPDFLLPKGEHFSLMLEGGEAHTNQQRERRP